MTSNLPSLGDQKESRLGSEAPGGGSRSPCSRVQQPHVRRRTSRESGRRPHERRAVTKARSGRPNSRVTQYKVDGDLVRRRNASAARAVERHRHARAGRQTAATVQAVRPQQRPVSTSSTARSSICRTASSVSSRRVPRSSRSTTTVRSGWRTTGRPLPWDRAPFSAASASRARASASR